MEIIYKFVSDELIQTHQFLNLQESDMNSALYTSSDSESEIEEIKELFFNDIDKFYQSAFSEEDTVFLFQCIDQFDYLSQPNRIDFLKKLNSFFVKIPDPDILNQIVQHLKDFRSSNCIEVFSRVLLSAISLNPELIDKYEHIYFPLVAIDLMNLFEEDTFPSLICLFTKTLDNFDTMLFNEIKKLIEISKDPYYYGIAIYRYAELSEELAQVNNLITPLNILFSKDAFKYYLKTLVLLAERNHDSAFFYSYKKIFSVVNWQVFDDEKVDLLDDEDILNSLSFINQFSMRVGQIPNLCKETNIDFIIHLTQNPNPEIRLKAIFILSNLSQNALFQEDIPIPYLAQLMEEVCTDLPFSLKPEALDIYTIIADMICISDIEILVTDFFIDFMFEFFGNEDKECLFKLSNICMIVADKSPLFAEALSNEISECEDIFAYDESVFPLFECFCQYDCK